MGFKKILNAVSPIASVINKSGPVAKMLGMQQKKGIATPSGRGLGLENLVKQAQAQNALQEGQARVAAASAPKVTPTPMSEGGRATHKMPDGKMMAGASHKMGHGGKVKGSSSSVSKRADGCAVKGKTRGRMI